MPAKRGTFPLRQTWREIRPRGQLIPKEETHCAKETDFQKTDRHGRHCFYRRARNAVAAKQANEHHEFDVAGENDRLDANAGGWRNPPCFPRTEASSDGPAPRKAGPGAQRRLAPHRINNRESSSRRSRGPGRAFTAVRQCFAVGRFNFHLFDRGSLRPIGPQNRQ